MDANEAEAFLVLGESSRSNWRIQSCSGLHRESSAAAAGTGGGFPPLLPPNPTSAMIFSPSAEQQMVFQAKGGGVAWRKKSRRRHGWTGARVVVGLWGNSIHLQLPESSATACCSRAWLHTQLPFFLPNCFQLALFRKGPHCAKLIFRPKRQKLFLSLARDEDWSCRLPLPPLRHSE